MPKIKGRILPVVIGAAVVVTGANVASYAANGHPITLGGYHTETSTTTVRNTGSGPAFRFKSEAGTAPFAVNSSAKVAHLNAARLEGMRAGQLSRGYRFVIPANTQLPASFQATGLPPGHYDATFDLFVSGSDSEPTACYMADSRHALAFAAEGSPALEGLGPISASGPITVARTGEAGVICFSDGQTEGLPGSGFKNVMTFTRVDRVVKGTTGTGATPPAKRFQKQLLGR
jgi:hypothetical protein